MRLIDLIEQVCRLHQELPKNGLVSWTSGNISGRHPKSGLIVIKPSGEKYEDLKPWGMIVTNLAGEVWPKGSWGEDLVREFECEGPILYRPSTDLASHLCIYRQRPDIKGIVHTHSPYATAFAATGQSIPCILTAMADEFGGPIPCTKKIAEIGSDAIGKSVLDVIGWDNRFITNGCAAILLRGHGVFTVADSVEGAVKAAVMVESIAKTVYLALQIAGRVTPEFLMDFSLSEEEISKNFNRYKETYGQPGRFDKQV